MPRARRLCRGGCKRIVAGTYCPDCQRAAEARRGSTTQRSYGAQHQAARKRLLREALQADRDGRPLRCGMCGQPMHAWQPLEAAHTTPLALEPGGVADALQHAACNPRGTSAANYERQAR